MDFDWTTFVFEIINFLVLLAILERFVFRPLRRGITARRAAQAQREQATAQALEEATQQRAAYEQRFREIDRLRQEAMREAAEQAAAERARVLAQAREDAAAERARAQSTLAAERQAALTRMRELVVARSTDIAGHLLAQIAPGAVEHALWAQMHQAIEGRAGDIAAAWQARNDDGRGAPAQVEVTCAHAPGEDEVARLGQALAAVVGAAPRLRVREDAALVAGLVLCVGHLVLDMSVAGQLDAIRDRARALLQELPEEAEARA